MIITWVLAGLGVVEQARLGRNSSLDSWEDAEGGVELGVGAEAGVGVEGAADFYLLASFFRTASLVLWSAVDETVFLQWFFRKSRSSLVMRLEDLRCSKAMSKRPSMEEVKRANFFLKESLCLFVTGVLMRAL